MTTDLIRGNVPRDYQDYLRDESRRTGAAESISFPAVETELRAVLRELYAARTPITVQGARTGITGGAVPDGGHILNLSRMNRMLGLRQASVPGTYLLTVQPGVSLAGIRDAVRLRKFVTDGWSKQSLDALAAFRSSPPCMFAPDLTEVSASAGGLTACNGSGARSLYYGATRRNIESVRAILVDGVAVELARGAPRAAGRVFHVPTDAGTVIEGRVPSYRMPEVKNAAGYYAADDMDILDLFIGSEGTLGILSEIELRLVPAPGAMWGVTAFLPDEASAIAFVRAVRSNSPRPAAVELIDCRALDLLRAQKASNPAFASIPELPTAWHTAIYVEYHAIDESAAEAAVEGVAGILEACGGDMDATWLAAGEREIERFKAVRHAVPEAINLLIDARRKTEPRLTKLGTDLAVPDDRLEEVLALYHEGLDGAGLEFAMFGHIGNNHVHVNIIPRDLGEYARGKQLYVEWARRVVGMGGTVSAEHGVGKLKAALLPEMYGDEGIAEMRAVKTAFDPFWLLNRGNLFADERGKT